MLMALSLGLRKASQRSIPGSVTYRRVPRKDWGAIELAPIRSANLVWLMERNSNEMSLNATFPHEEEGEEALLRSRNSGNPRAGFSSISPDAPTDETLV
jgi:hypothetical protein